MRTVSGVKNTLQSVGNQFEMVRFTPEVALRERKWGQGRTGHGLRIFSILSVSFRRISNTNIGGCVSNNYGADQKQYGCPTIATEFYQRVRGSICLGPTGRFYPHCLWTQNPHSSQARTSLKWVESRPGRSRICWKQIRGMARAERSTVRFDGLEETVWESQARVSRKLKTKDSISSQSDRMPTRAGHAKIRAFAFARHKPVASARRACTTYIQKKNYNCAKTLGT